MSTYKSTVLRPDKSCGANTISNRRIRLTKLSGTIQRGFLGTAGPCIGFGVLLNVSSVDVCLP